MSDPVASDLHNADELGHYRSLSSASVLALCLGIASPVILASSFWSILPIAGVAVGLLALARISASGGALTGSLLAKAGIALSVVSFFLPISKDYVRREVALGQARDVAELWLERIVSGDGQAAAQLVLPQKLYEMTVPPPASGQRAPTAYSPEDGMAKFSASDEVQQLSRVESIDSFEFLPAESAFLWKGRAPEIRCSYAFESSDATEQSCSIVLTRRSSSVGSLVWLVKEWEIVSPEKT